MHPPSTARSGVARRSLSLPAARAPRACRAHHPRGRGLPRRAVRRDRRAPRVEPTAWRPRESKSGARGIPSPFLSPCSSQRHCPLSPHGLPGEVADAVAQIKHSWLKHHRNTSSAALVRVRPDRWSAQQSSAPRSGIAGCWTGMPDVDGDAATMVQYRTRTPTSRMQEDQVFACLRAAPSIAGQRQDKPATELRHKKSLADLLREHNLPPMNIICNEYDETSSNLAVHLLKPCEVSFKDSSMIQYAPHVKATLSRGKLSGIEGMETKVVPWDFICSKV